MREYTEEKKEKKTKSEKISENLENEFQPEDEPKKNDEFENDFVPIDDPSNNIDKLDNEFEPIDDTNIKSKKEHSKHPDKYRRIKEEKHNKEEEKKYLEEKYRVKGKTTKNIDTTHDSNENTTEEKIIDEKEEIKEYIKNFEWDEKSPNWIVTDKKTGNPINLDPAQDCSKQNPLYKSEKWLNRIYNDEKLDLSDRKISEIYNLSHKTIGNWRKRLGIPTKPEKGQYMNDGYVVLYMPENYRHPELKPLSSKGRIRRKEHDIVMENYLKKHLESGLSKRNLIEGKYLKTKCEVHHINYIRNDNRLENLWLYKTKSEHGNAQRSLNDCFSGLYKLGQIQFNEGKYYVTHNFDYKIFDPSEIRRIIKPTEFKGDMSINKIKDKIKTLNWDDVTDDWTVWKNSNQFGEVRMTVVPYKDCLKENPLYRHKLWMETIVKEKQFNLTDPRLAEVCGISESTAYKWRWNHHRIPTYYERWGNIRTLSKSKSAGDRVRIKIPNDHKNPSARKLSRQNTMLEHRYAMEKYLAKHPELEISQKSLIDGKFLKPEYKVHHINLDSLDNRLENLWVCEEHAGHNSVHASLIDTVNPLMKSDLLSFKDGKYHLYNKEIED